MIKNRKHRFTTLLIMIISLIMVTACGNQSTQTSEQGNKLAQGITEKEILIGHLGPQTGPVAVYDYFRKGIDAYFKYVNENGGVNGRSLKLIAYDDQYQPSRTIKNATRIVKEDKVFAILGNPCTPCNSAARSIYEKAGIPMVMTSSGAQEFVDPPLKNYYGSSILNYRIETRVFVDYAVNELKAKKIGVVYQNDDYGKEGLTVLQEAKDIELVAEVPYVAGDTDLSTHAQHLEKAKPDAIIVLGGPTQAANLKKELHKIGIKDTPYMVSSVGANDRNLFKLAGNDVWEGTLSAAAFPMPDVSNDPSMKIYEEQFKKYYPNDPIDGFAQNGWAIAEVMVEALNRTGENLTWDNFYKALNTFENWDGSIFEGVTFNKDNHYGLTTMIMTQAKNGQILPLSGKITFDPVTTKITYE